jgi:Fur family zinc uptake transcriptional regulator
MAARCEHAGSSAQGLNGARLDRAVDAALARCEGLGERMTAPRRRVLERLLAASAPVKAYDLTGPETAGTGAKPPTVYRALAFLERMGLAHRIESLNAYVACRLGDQPHAAAFLICDCCGSTREIAPAGVERLVEASTEVGFRIETVAIEVHGHCQACAAA